MDDDQVCSQIVQLAYYLAFDFFDESDDEKVNPHQLRSQAYVRTWLRLIYIDERGV